MARFLPRVVAAGAAARMWCASLVCATATATAVGSSGLGVPAYVVSGRFPDSPPDGGADDLLTAEFIEAVRCGAAPDPAAVARDVRASREAEITLALGAGHVHPDDIAYATDVDRFDFAMEVERRPTGLCLVAVRL